MDKARYYKAKVRVCDQDGTSNCTSYSNLSTAFALPDKLAKPTNLDVEPILFRKAKIDWAGDINAGSYTIKQTGSETADINVKDATEKEIALDDYLDDNIVDTFRIKAVSDNDLYEDSGYSDTIRIVDSPILRADGDNSSLASSATTGSSTITWKKIAGVTKYIIKYRKMPGTSNDKHSNSQWTVNNARTPLLASTVTYSTPPTKTRLTHTKTGLLLGEIYSIQLNYEQNGQKVFSGRDAYVWPSKGLPAEDKRVATYPYFGHWPDREFTYRICENTFPTSDKTKWVRLINEAFEQWETATDDLITITHDTSTHTCASDQSPIALILREYPHEDERLHTNDVYMVDDLVLDNVVKKAAFTGFIGDLEGICVFLTPGACVISNAYGSDAEASAELSNAVGSTNGVDVLIKKSAFEDYNMDRPLSVRFNQCFDPRTVEIGGEQRDAYYPYTTMVHEAGHALGASGFSRWNLLRFIDGSITGGISGGTEKVEEELYKRAHPSVPDAVMNYDKRVLSVDDDETDDDESSEDEPDCSPHPFDILAIWALYQTVDR